MAMEIEVKYQIPDIGTLEEIWNDKELVQLAVPDSNQIVRMRSLYYDTPERVLNRAGITLRVRREGDEAFCTVKWNGKLIHGIHKREEVNIPIDMNRADDAPGSEVFAECPKGTEIEGLTKDSALITIVSMEFTRRRRRLIYDGNIMELALDSGKIFAGDKSCDILEMELEHYEGNDSLAVLELGEVIADRYGLELQPKSKYARGLALLK